MQQYCVKYFKIFNIKKKLNRKPPEAEEDRSKNPMRFSWNVLCYEHSESKTLLKNL